MTTEQQHDAEHPEAEVSPDKLWEQARTDRQPPQDEQALDEEQPESTQEDALAGLPEPTRRLIEEIRTKSAEQEKALKDTQQKLARAHGTIGNLTQRLNVSLKDLQTIKPAVDAVQQRAEEDARQKEAREYAEKVARRKAAREKALEIHDQATVDEMLPELPDKMPEKPKPAAKPAEQEQQQSQQRGETAEQLKYELALTKAHPDWEKTITTPEFKAFYEQQTPEFQLDDIALMTAFKKHQQETSEAERQQAEAARLEAERKERLNRSETVQGRPTSQSGRQLTDADLWEQAKRDRAKARAA